MCPQWDSSAVSSDSSTLTIHHVSMLQPWGTLFPFGNIKIRTLCSIGWQARSQCLMLLLRYQMFVYNKDLFQKRLGIAGVTNYCDMCEATPQHLSGHILCQRLCLPLLLTCSNDQQTLPAHLVHPDPCLVQVHVQGFLPGSDLVV